MEHETIEYTERDGVAVVTLNRPEVYNAFDDTMRRELRDTWQSLRRNDDVRAVVLTAAGDKAFCTGIDRSGVPAEEGEYDFSPYSYDDPGKDLGPRSQQLWKPVIAAVNGIACGGAFYLLGESDIIIAAEHATFFDPHVTYGMPAVFEPTLMLARMPFGEAMRMSLTGASERIGAAKAESIGLVTQVVPADQLQATAFELAATIASFPAPAVQATLRTLWAARDLTPAQAIELGNVFLHLSMSAESMAESQQSFTTRDKRKPVVR
ncbi:MAG: enoyl-CoA hydratase/isomerase family protein [Microthrixaceae bacterium]